MGAVIHSASVTSGSRLGSIALFVLIGARIVRSGLRRILALVTLASIMAALFGGELLDPIGVPGICFPFGIGVTLGSIAVGALRSTRKIAGRTPD